MPPPPPPPPTPTTTLLMDELLEEILVRLPPDSPASLIRAGVVCKRWCRLVSNPGFQRRLLDFHRQSPPILGFLIRSNDLPYPNNIGTRFVPTTSASGGGALPHANLCRLQPCDSRHGRVLFTKTYSCFGMVIWNPITGEQLKLPDPPSAAPQGSSHLCNWTAAVLCAATVTGGTCNHLDCHRHGPFIVALVGDDIARNKQKFTCIYSSETGVWSKPTVALRLRSADESPGSIATWIRNTLVGNTLYFMLQSYKRILEYNLCTGRASVIKLPRAAAMGRSIREYSIQLTTTEDGRLGFARVEDYSRLCLWSREEDEEPAGGWVLSKVIQLDKLLPIDERRACLNYLVGSAEGAGTIFLRLKHEIFTVDLRSGRVTKVYAYQGKFFSHVVVPYVNFCTPGTRRQSPSH